MLKAQNQYSFQFRKYQVNDGLSENTVTSVIQDKKGFIWIGTKDGLNKFDGTKFTVYRRQNNENSIKNNFIKSIIEDGNTLYIGTDDGVYIMDPYDESFIRLEEKLNSSGKIITSVNSLFLDSKERLWINSMYEGLFLFDIQKAELRRINCENYNLAQTSVWTTLEDRSGVIWVGTRIGLLQYNPNKDRLEPVEKLTNYSNNAHKEILTIFEDEKGNLWLGTWDSGIIFYNKQHKGFSSFCNRGSKDYYISHIRSFLQYDSEHLLIGADDGLYMFNTENKQVTRIDVPYNQYSLGDQNVYCLLRDREGGIWAGTYFGGLNYLSPNTQCIDTFFPTNQKGSLSGKAISQFCEDKNGNLWIATEDGGLNFFNPKTKEFSQPIKTSYHNIHPLLLVGDELWIGTFSRGIDVYNTKTKHMRNYCYHSKDPNSIDNDCVFSLYQTKTGNIYVGTTTGLCKYNPQTDNFSQIRPDSISFVYDIKEDSYQNLWIASFSQGIIKYKPTTDKWTFYNNIVDKKAPIANSKLTSIYIDVQKRLWISSEGKGIFLYNYEKDSFKNISEKDGLPNDVVYGILDDQFGNVWISSNSGLLSFHPEKDHTSQIYTQEDGLPSTEFNYKSSFKSSDGKLYFGSINGFVSFYPQNLNQNRNAVIPPVAITGIQLLDDNDAELNRHIRKCINNGELIQLKYNSSFTISYTSLSYVAQAKNQYAYKLDEIDANWNQVGNNQNVTYVNLAPGKYTFKVKASNNHSVWNEQGTELHFEILPPLWLSLPAKILYWLLSITTITAIIHYIIRRSSKKQKQQLETYKKEQESLAFKSKIDFFTNIAHEIRTPVSLIKAPLEEIILSGDGNNSTKQNLSIIEKNSERLSTLINQLLDFRKIDSAQYMINAGKVDLVKLITELYERFQKTAQSKKIDFQLTLPEEASFEVISDPDALTKIIGNFLTNALKYTKDTIILQLKKENDDTIAISVADNGEGIPNDFKAQIFAPFYQIKSYDNQKGTGIGLSLAKHLSDILEGTIKITDNAVGGTIFTFTFKSLSQRTNETSSIVQSEMVDTEIAIDESINEPINEQRHVLIIEDNPDMQNFIQESLKGQYKVNAADSAEKAIQMINSAAYDLILSDIVLPKMDGIEFTRTIRKDLNYSHIPIILLSAKTDNTTKVEGLDAGADVFIEKPFSTAYLKAQISSMLGSRKAIIDAFNQSPLTSYSILTSNKHDLDFINKLNEEIDKNISNSEFSIESLTDKLFISRSNLQRKLKSICGFTPGDYLRTYRLKKAAQLLLEDKLRINEASYELGFSSPSYFTKCFAKQFGMLPKEFIKQKSNQQTKDQSLLNETRK